MKKTPISVGLEIFGLIAAVIIGSIMLIVHVFVTPFLDPMLFVAIIILLALCAGALIAIFIINKKMNNYYNNGDDE